MPEILGSEEAALCCGHRLNIKGCGHRLGRRLAQSEFDKKHTEDPGWRGYIMPEVFGGETIERNAKNIQRIEIRSQMVSCGVWHIHSGESENHSVPGASNESSLDSLGHTAPSLRL